MAEKVKILLGVLYGLGFGIALLVPGFSGGTLLVMFGCYDKICGAMALDFKLIKKHFLFFVLFGVGTLVGLAAAAMLITDLFKSYPLWTNLALVALILVGVPAIIKNATEQEKFKPVCLIPALIGAGAVVAMMLTNFTGAADGETATIGTVPLVIFSAISAVTLIIPGVSGAFMLLMFGIYDTVTSAISVSNPNFAVLVPAGLGIVAGIVAGAKLVSFLLKRWRLMVYSAIIGMVVASVVMLAITSIVQYA
jgi:putative membrane protein